MKNQHDIIRSVLKKRKWWTPMNLQDAYQAKTGKRLCDSTLTRRLREMSDVVCQHKIKDGKQRWEYRVIGMERKAS